MLSQNKCELVRYWGVEVSMKNGQLLVMGLEIERFR